jgi:hypothetical protein
VSALPLIISFNHNTSEQSYTHDTSFNTSVTPTGMTRGSSPQVQLSATNFCEHMRTSRLTSPSSCQKRVYVLPISDVLSLETDCLHFRRLRPSRPTFSTIYRRLLPASPPSSRTSSNDTLVVLSKTSRTRSSGGSRTEQSTPVSLGWHSTICRSQVSVY